MRPMLAPVAVLVAAACHEGRLPISTSPTDSGAGVLTILSGETQSPVAGARVLVAGEVYSSDASGRVFLRLTSSELDIEASGYLDRQTLLSSDRFTLWPRSSPTGLDEDSTARLVYGCAAPGCPGGGEPLMRLPRGAAVLVPSGGLRADRRAVEALEEGARRLSSAAEGEITLDVAANPRSSAALVTVQVDGRDPVILALGAGAVTRRELTARSEIVRASITFRTLELARRLPLVLHELGHVYGLSHSGRAGDVMWTGPEIYRLDDYSPRERLAIALMLQRFPGNRLPDHDRAIHAARSGSRARDSVIACHS